jgi:hypothetical protein
LIEINVDKYYAWLSEGRSFSAIREDLKAEGFSEEQIKQINTTLNDWLLTAEHEKVKQSVSRQWRLAGWTLAIITASLTIYSFLKSSSSIIIISMGGAFLSWGMIYMGYKIQRGPSLFQPRFKKRRSTTR